MVDEPTLLSLFHKLNGILSVEKALLNDRNFAELGSIIESKSRVLLEISKASKGAASPFTEEFVSVLSSAKAELLESEKLLAMHLNAANALSTMITDSMIEELSDGTYAASCRPVRA